MTNISPSSTGAITPPSAVAARTPLQDRPAASPTQSHCAIIVAQIIFAASMTIVRAAFKDSSEVSPVVLVFFRITVAMIAFSLIHLFRMRKRRQVMQTSSAPQLTLEKLYAKKEEDVKPGALAIVVSSTTSKDKAIDGKEPQDDLSNDNANHIVALRPPSVDEYNDLSRSMKWRCAVLGILGTTINMLMSGTGVKYAGAITSGAMQCAIPPFTCVFAFIVLGETMSPIKIFSLLLSVCGNLIMAQVWRLGEDISSSEALYYMGCLALLTNVTGYSAYLVLQKPILRMLPKSEFFFRTYIFGWIGIAVIGAAHGTLIWDQVTQGIVTPRVWFAIMFSGIVNSTFAYYLVTYGIAGVSAGAAAVYFCLQPVFIGVFSTVFLDEGLTMIQFWGGLLILGGVVVGALPQLHLCGGVAPPTSNNVGDSNSNSSSTTSTPQTSNNHHHHHHHVSEMAATQHFPAAPPLSSAIVVMSIVAPSTVEELQDDTSMHCESPRHNEADDEIAEYLPRVQ